MDSLQAQQDSQARAATGRVTLFAVGVLVGLVLALIVVGVLWLLPSRGQAPSNTCSDSLASCWVTWDCFLDTPNVTEQWFLRVTIVDSYAYLPHLLGLYQHFAHFSISP